jgi:DNA invertase Pin-like site-specific DNA recombinase
VQKQAAPTGKIIGYARVSTADQNLRSQIDALEREGCWNIYKEHASASKRRTRKQLELALMDLRPGDTLVVYKLDRLTRNLRELFLILDRVHASGAGFRSITEGIDWSTPTGRLLLSVFGAVAQFVAEQTSERTSAGIRALQERGYAYGPKPMLNASRAARLVKLATKKGANKSALARKFGMTRASVINYIKRAKARKR